MKRSYLAPQNWSTIYASDRKRSYLAPQNWSITYTSDKALFSALEQTHCTLVARDSKWVTAAHSSNSPQKWLAPCFDLWRWLAPLPHADLPRAPQSKPCGQRRNSGTSCKSEKLDVREIIQPRLTVEHSGKTMRSAAGTGLMQGTGSRTVQAQVLYFLTGTKLFLLLLHKTNHMVLKFWYVS